VCVWAQRLAELEAQLARAKGVQAELGQNGEATVMRQKELEVEITMYQKREQVWEERVKEQKVQMAQQEQYWRGKVAEALEDDSAQPAVQSLKRESERLRQEVASLKAQVRGARHTGAFRGGVTVGCGGGCDS
jgi:hypothetical protein